MEGRISILILIPTFDKSCRNNRNNHNHDKNNPKSQNVITFLVITGIRITVTIEKPTIISTIIMHNNNHHSDLTIAAIVMILKIIFIVITEYKN